MTTRPIPYSALGHYGEHSATSYDTWWRLSPNESMPCGATAWGGSRVEAYRLGYKEPDQLLLRVDSECANPAVLGHLHYNAMDDTFECRRSWAYYCAACALKLTGPAYWDAKRALE